jgi:hypothetical protein
MRALSYSALSTGCEFPTDGEFSRSQKGLLCQSNVITTEILLSHQETYEQAHCDCDCVSTYHVQLTPQVEFAGAVGKFGQTWHRSPTRRVPFKHSNCTSTSLESAEYNVQVVPLLYVVFSHPHLSCTYSSKRATHAHNRCMHSIVSHARRHILVSPLLPRIHRCRSTMSSLASAHTACTAKLTYKSEQKLNIIRAMLFHVGQTEPLLVKWTVSHSGRDNQPDFSPRAREEE